MKKKKQVVFLEAYSTAMSSKMAELLKKKGYETVLIRLLKPTQANLEFYDNLYDNVINVNLNFARLSIKNFPSILISLLKNLKSLFLASIKIFKLKPYVIIGRAAPSWPVAIFRRLFKKTPLIYFPYDIRALLYPTVEVAKKIGGLSKFEIKSERFCLENCDGILHKSDPNALNFINGMMLGNNISLPNPKLSLLPYCSREYMVPLNKKKISKKDNGIHIVYINSIGADAGIYRDLFFMAKEIINAKIHFHLYSQLNTESKGNPGKDTFTKEYKNSSNFNYFHIHESKNPKQIVGEISKYDYGFYPIPPKYDYKMRDPEFTLGNKISTYLEAGIPFFYSNEHKYIDKLMRNYGLKLPFTPEELKVTKNLRKKLKNINYKKIEKNILKAREDFLMEKQVLRLEKFIQEVVREKHAKSEI